MTGTESDAIHGSADGLAVEGASVPSTSSPDASPPMRVLFVCAENAARSQMAEGLLRARGGSKFAVFSAGTTPNGVHPMAVRAMHELDIDISGHVSKDLRAFREKPMDYVVTLCDTTRELSPSIRAREMVIHHPFDDPAADGSLRAFQRVRDALDAWIERTFLFQAA